jgi:hypothetical protein
VLIGLNMGDRAGFSVGRGLLDLPPNGPRVIKTSHVQVKPLAAL